MIRNKTSFLTAGSNGGIDDEYYVDEIIGIDDFTYSDYSAKHSDIDQHLINLEKNVKNVRVILWKIYAAYVRKKFMDGDTILNHIFIKV